MKAFGFFVFLVFLLIVGGAFTSLLLSGDGALLPFLQQTSDPAASAMEVEGWQAEQFFLLAGFIIFNMIGMGATIAFIVWLLSRSVKSVRADGTSAVDTAVAEG